MSQTNFQFGNTPNPAPAPLSSSSNTVQWTVTGADPNQVQWQLKAGSAVVTLNPSSDGLSCAITAITKGWSTVWVHQKGGGQPISRCVGVGQLLAYNAQHTLGQAPSHLWTVCSDPSQEHVPTYSKMQSYGMAFDAVSGKLIINYSYLNSLHGKHVSATNTSPTYFKASTPQGGSSGTDATVNTYYAYGPDGTLWKLEPNWSGIPNAPTNVPAPTEMTTALAWIPDEPSAISNRAGGSDYVMCFLLNQENFDFTPGTTTYYTFTP